MTAVLPLDEPSREDGRVALAFLAYTAVRPTATSALRDETAQMTAFIAGLLPGGDAGRAAGVLALTEGPGVYLLGGHFSPEQARQALDAQLDLVFGG